MKRILLSLAAVAALASCVKENIVAPVEGQLTISAVSADSKTVLDDLNVVWENTDKIAVVVNAETRVTAEFSIDENTIDGSAADFVGTIGSLKNATSAYAVYPATAAELTHTLPADQTAGVSGLMLSSAALDVDDMKDDAATAKFYPAVSLLQVAVPAGVKSVELTSAGAALVGPATFEVNADGSLAVEPTAEATKTVVLAAETALEVKTYPVVVYPGEVGDLTLKLVGTEGEEFTKTVSGITLAVAEARTINLMQIFQFAPEAIEVAPNGGNFEIPFTTTVEEVTVTENADWLESSVVVKGFQTGNVCLVADANEGDETRTAEVTVSWGEGKSVSFTVTQDAIFRGFLNDADGNPIQWEETFGLYTSESDANAANVANATTNHENVFTIELSDDYTKGTYIVDNIFKATSYYNNGQPVSNKGGKFYANYKDGKLTLLYANSVNCYGFTSDVTISYDETAKTFSAPALKVYDYSVYRDRYIGGYAAVVKVEEPEVGDSPLAGEWNQTVVFGANSAVKTGAASTALVSVSGNQVTIENFVLDGAIATGTLSGNTITIAKANSGLPTTYGPVDNDIVITVSSDNKTMTAANITSGYGYGIVVDSWTAEISASAAPSPLAGEWNQTVVFGANSAVKTGAASTALVSVSGDQVTIENFVLDGVTATGTLSGNTITIAKANSGLPTTYGPVDNDIVITVSSDNKTMTAANITSGYGYGIVVDSWTATMVGGTEPELPAEPSVNIAGTWNQTVVGMSWPSPSATMTITVDGSSVTLTDFVAAGTVVTTTFENNQIVVPAGTMIGSGSSMAGPLDADVVLTLEGNTFTAAPFSIGGFMNITSYSATNPDMEVGGGEEPEVPADPWTSDAVVTYDLPANASSGRQVLRQIKYFADAENLYIKLQASATLFTEKNVAYLGLMLFDTTAGTEGSGYWGWWKDAKGNLEFNKEHAGTFNGTDLVLNVGDEQIEAAAETSDDLYVWTFAIPRSAHEVLALDKVYMGVLVMEAFEPCGAMPDKYGDMLEVTLP